LLAAIFTGLGAQENHADSTLLQQIKEGKQVFEVPHLETTPARKVDFGFQAGSSVWMSGHRNALFSSYIAPEVRFHATPRFQLNTGIMFSQGFLPGAAEGQNGFQGNRFNSFTLFAEGRYLVSERLSFSGMVLKELDPGLDPRINTFYRNTGMQAVGMGVNYKLTENIHFGAQIRVSDGMPASRFSPSYMHDPYRTAPFFRPDPWW